VDVHGTDPSARLALAATRLALGDAGVRVSGAVRERAGLFAACTRVSPESLGEYRRSIERGGLERCSATAFARLVLHAPAGAVSRLLSLRGPTTTLAADGIAGLMAFAYAADTIARREDADLMLSVALDERSREVPGPEGAVALAIHADRGHGPCVSGVASGGAGELDATIERALSRAGSRADEVASWQVSTEPDPFAPSLASGSLALDATRAVREGAVVAVAAAACRSACCAVVLTSEPRNGRA
jgi:3-oxoacyl-[acyl-carrier-protein] synthase II